MGERRKNKIIFNAEKWLGALTTSKDRWNYYLGLVQEKKKKCYVKDKSGNRLENPGYDSYITLKWPERFCGHVKIFEIPEGIEILLYMNWIKSVKDGPTFRLGFFQVFEKTKALDTSRQNEKSDTKSKSDTRTYLPPIRNLSKNRICNGKFKSGKKSGKDCTHLAIYSDGKCGFHTKCKN